MAQVTYCNTSTDLVGAYARIEQSRDLRVIKSFKPYTVANVFSIGKVGSFEAMYEDNVLMTAQAFSVNLATTLAALTAQEYYYDSTNDVLYFYPTGGVPDNHTFQIGENWASIKTRAVQDASRDADAILDVKYSIPIHPSPSGSASVPYDRDLVKAVAKIACSHLLSRMEPMSFDSSDTAQNTPAQLYDEGKRILLEYVDGKRAFSWEITGDEVGKWNITPDSANTSEGIFQLRGQYTPSAATTDSFDDAFWKVKISTGGVLGTAYYQLSTDNGTTYGTAAVTANTWVLLSSGIYIRWLPRSNAATDFILNDTWQIELYGTDREVTRPGIRSIPITVI